LYNVNNLDFLQNTLKLQDSLNNNGKCDDWLHMFECHVWCGHALQALDCREAFVWYGDKKDKQGHTTNMQQKQA